VAAGTFRNVILCEDIRDEVGNKKSLMGVMAGGGINVASFPATIKVAVFLEYEPGAADGDHITADFRLLQGDTEIAKARFETAIPQPPVVFVFPTGLMTCEKEGTFRMYVAINGRPEEELLSKNISVAHPATS